VESPESILRGLSDAQARAVLHDGDALRVEGGPGTGKTEVLVRLAMRMARSEGVRPEAILFVSTSSARSADVTRRAREQAGASAAAPPFVSLTPYHLARRILARSGDGPGRLRTAGRYAAWLLLRRLPSARGATPRFAAEARALFSLLERHDVAPGDLARARDALARAGRPLDPWLDAAVAMFREFEEALEASKLAPPGSLAGRAAKALARGTDASTHALLVDDAHELDPADRRLVDAVAAALPRGEHGGPRVVAALDPGAIAPRESSPFFAPREGTEVVVLRRSFRCPGPILDAAASVATLFAADDPTPVALPEPAAAPVGARVELIEEDTAPSEAFFVARKVRELLAEGLRPSEIAVVCRSVARSARPIETALRGYEIPYQALGGGSLFRSPVVNLLIRYLRVLSDPNDEASLAAILQAMPLRLDPIGVARVLREARRSALPLAVGLHRFQDRLDPAERSAFRRFTDDLARLAEEAGRVPLPRLLGSVYRTGGFFEDLARRGDAGVAQDAANLRKFHEMALEFSEFFRATTGGVARPADFLADLDLLVECLLDESEAIAGDEPDEAVSILGLHQARGREFRAVFLTGLSEGRFPVAVPSPPLAPLETLLPLFREIGIDPPWPRSLEEHLASERRLLVLGLTRASERLYVTRARRAREDEAVSPFFATLRDAGLPFSESPYGKSQSGLEPAKIVSSSEMEFLLRKLLAGREDRIERARGIVARFPELDAEYISGARDYGERDDPVDLPADLHLTATSLRDFLHCPRKYFYARCLDVERPQSHRASLGTFVHGILEEFHRRHPALAGADLDDLRADLLEVLGRRWEEAEDEFESRLEAEVVRTTCEAMIDGYLESEAKRAPGRRTEFLEEHIHFEIDGVRVSAKIDRIDRVGDRLEVIDYKTTRHRIKEEALKKKFFNQDEKEDWHALDLQLPLYYFALKEGRDLEAAALGIYYVLGGRRGKTSPEIARLEITEGAGKKGVRPDELPRIRKTIREVLARVRVGRFPAEPTSPGECRTCEFRSICPAGRDNV